MTENREQSKAPSIYKKQIKIVTIAVILIELIALLIIIYLLRR
jgi:hypothetical protein